MKKLFLALVVVASTVGAASAQSFAFVEAQKILDTMPSRINGLKSIQGIEASIVSDLRTEDSLIQAMITKYKTDEIKNTPIQKQYEMERIQKRQMLFEQAQQEADQKLQQMSQELQQKNVKTITEAVKIVAKAKKITYIMDKSGFLYCEGGMDLTKDVIIEVLKLDKVN